jgi:AhpD family alkylhydroperoxidase
MALVRMIPEEEATGKVKEIYDDIKSKLEIDSVPPLYRSMAPSPATLEAGWNKKFAAMDRPGKLDSLTKHMIAVAVSATNGCMYCTEVHLEAAKKAGLDDEAVVELMAIVDTMSGLNKFVEGLQVCAD